MSSWAEQYRAVWESRFDQMDTLLTQLQTPHGKKGNDDAEPSKGGKKAPDPTIKPRRNLAELK